MRGKYADVEIPFVKMLRYHSIKADHSGGWNDRQL